jgi:hypothetical protein
MVIAFDPFSFGLGALQFGVSMYGQQKAKRRNKRAARKEQRFRNEELARQAFETGRDAQKVAQQAELVLGAAGVRSGAGTAAVAATIQADSIRAQEEFIRQIDHSRQKGGFAHSGFLGSSQAMQSAKKEAEAGKLQRGLLGNDRIMK